MKHFICIPHNVVYTIPSTWEELKNNEYDYGLIQVVSHLIKHSHEECMFTTPSYRKASNYNVIEYDLKKYYNDEEYEN
jgi:hypothetical protein